MIEIVNRQRKVSIDAAGLEKFAADLARTVLGDEPKYFTVAFVSDRRIRDLNRIFRDRDAATDVLSFPNRPDEFDDDADHLGDIIISAEQAVRQASENGLGLDLELKQLIAHGLLHLCGYDHETDDGEMNELELEIRDKLGIAN